LKLGLAIMALGALILLLGIYVVVAAPWDLMDFGGSSSSSYSTDSLFGSIFDPIISVLNWLFTTFIILVANLFLSGIALIVAGHALNKVSETENGQNIARAPQ